MATLAYPVSQSTTNKLFGPTIGTSFGNTKPSGKSFNTLTNVDWKWVLDTNKPTGNSVTTYTFVKFKIPLDTNKLSSMRTNDSWQQSDTAKLGVSLWYPENIKAFHQSSSNNQIISIGISAWIPELLSFDNSAPVAMTTGNVYAGSLVEPYLYETLTSGSMLLVRNTTIGIKTLSDQEAIHSYNEKMLTLNTGCVLAYGELQRNNGWVN